MTFNPQPKPEPRPKRGRKRIAHRRKRFSAEASKAMRERVWQEQDGRCAWCGLAMNESRWDLCHLDALGMGASRHDPSNRANARENVCGMHRGCHAKHEALIPHEREAVNEWLRVASLPKDGHGAQRTGRAVLGAWDEDDRRTRED